MSSESALCDRKVKLRNGVEVPMIGLGTFPVNKQFTPEQFVESVKWALKAGYRHIDSSKYYNNEHLIAQAINESKVRRDELFIASKVPPKDMGYDSTLRAFEATCQNLQTDYIGTSIYLYMDLI